MEGEKALSISFQNVCKAITPGLNLSGICTYLLKFLGDAKAGVDPLSALCVFGLIVLQEVASGEFSCYESEQRQVCGQRGTNT